MLSQNRLESAFNTSFTDSRDNWKGHCPFHDENTPSFLVHKREYLANCFGCGKSGYIDDLLAEYKGIPTAGARAILDIQFIDKLERRKDERSIRSYYPESWLGPFRSSIYTYTLQRGLGKDILKAAKTRIDEQFKRQIFPHYGREGKLLGVAGRSIYDHEPKWYFYWGYNKGRELYQLPNYRTSLESCVVVEGIFDVLAFEQVGIHAVSTLGTKFTQYQIKQLREYKYITLAMDNDISGDISSMRLFHRLKRSCDVQFFPWKHPEKDALDISGEELQDRFDDRVNYMEYMFNYVSRNAFQRAEKTS